jgi:hypothetical protein
MKTTKNKLMVVSKDPQIKKLIGFILDNEKESVQLEVTFESHPDSMMNNSCSKELLMIDVDELINNPLWIKVIKKRSNLHVLIQFTEMRSSTVQHVTELLQKSGAGNKVEFIILGNYSSELKLILLKEQISYLLNSN